MSSVGISHIEGVKTISSPLIRQLQQIDSFEAKILQEKFYYYLNTSEDVVHKIIANNLAISNEKLNAQIHSAITGCRGNKSSTWVLGGPGCGKTSQLVHSAFYFVKEAYPVILINLAILEEPVTVEYFQHLKEYFSFPADKPLLVFIDNAGDNFEAINTIFKSLNEDVYGFSCQLILFERVDRYYELPNRSDLQLREGNQKIEIDNLDYREFKLRVGEKFASALDLWAEDAFAMKNIIQNSPELSIGEQIILFRKEASSRLAESFKTEKEIFEEIYLDNDWLHLHGMLSYVSILHQFGIAVPLSLLKKVFPRAEENELKQFYEFLTQRKSQNIPLVLEGNNLLRTNHELVAHWFADTELSTSYKDYLSDIIRHIDTANLREKKLLHKICSKRSIHEKYFHHIAKDFAILMSSAEVEKDLYKQQLLYRLLGADRFRHNDIEEARKAYSRCITIDPHNRPVYMEWVDYEIKLKNYKKAIEILRKLLKANPETVNRAARKKIIEIYLAMKQYGRARLLLFEKEELLLTDEKYEDFWTLFIKVYHQFTRMELWLTEEMEAIRLKILYLNEIHYEICRAHLENRDWEKAKNHLLCAVRIKPNDEHFVAELKKLYKKMGKTPAQIHKIFDAIQTNPLNLNYIKKMEKSRVETQVPVG